MSERRARWEYARWGTTLVTTLYCSMIHKLAISFMFMLGEAPKRAKRAYARSAERGEMYPEGTGK